MILKLEIILPLCGIPQERNCKWFSIDFESPAAFYRVNVVHKQSDRGPKNSA